MTNDNSHDYNNNPKNYDGFEIVHSEDTLVSREKINTMINEVQPSKQRYQTSSETPEVTLVDYDLPIKITQNTLASDLNFVKNKKVMGEATFDGVTFESGTDLSNFTDIKLTNCDLSNLDVKLAPGCMITIGDGVKFPKDENGQDILPKGWQVLEGNTLVYVGNNYEEAINQVSNVSEEEMANLMAEAGTESIDIEMGGANVFEEDIVIDGESIEDALEKIHEGQIVVTGKTTFRNLESLSIVNLEPFQGQLRFENCDLTDLADFEFKHEQKIEIEGCNLPDPLPEGWKKEENALIYEMPRTYEQPENNQVIEFDDSNINDFRFLTKDLHENNTYTDAPIVIRNVKLKGEIDLRNLKNVRFENCDLSGAKIITSDDDVKTNITADANTLLPKDKKSKNLITQDPEKEEKGNIAKQAVTEVELGKVDYDGLKAQAELVGIRYGIGAVVEGTASENILVDFGATFTEKQVEKAGKGLLKNTGKKFKVTYPGEETFDRTRNWYKNTRVGRVTGSVGTFAGKVCGRPDGVLKHFARTQSGLRVYKTAKGISKYVGGGIITSGITKFTANMMSVDFSEAAHLAKIQGNFLKSNLFQCTEVMMAGGRSALKLTSKLMPGINIFMGGKGAIESFQNGDVAVGVLKLASTALKFAGPIGNAAAVIIDVGLLVYEAYRKYEEKKAREEAYNKMSPEEKAYYNWKQEFLSRCVRSENGNKFKEEDLKKLYEALSKLPEDKYDAYMNNQITGEFNIETELEKIKNIAGVKVTTKQNNGQSSGDKPSVQTADAGENSSEPVAETESTVAKMVACAKMYHDEQIANWFSQEVNCIEALNMLSHLGISVPEDPNIYFETIYFRDDGKPWITYKTDKKTNERYLAKSPEERERLREEMKRQYKAAQAKGRVAVIETNTSGNASLDNVLAQHDVAENQPVQTNINTMNNPLLNNNGGNSMG